MVGTDLRAFHFISKGKTRILLWELTDSISSCPEDLELSAGFMLEGFEVTDLDNNGLGETWLIYKMSCRGDVSPATMKIAMHEGVKKYLICGENRVPYKDGKYLGGQREMDDNFINGPKQFSEFGSALWDRFIDETFK